MTVSAGKAIPNSKLRHLRQDRAWSLQDVADGLARVAAEEGRHVQVGAETIGRWERGNIRRPDAINLQLLVRLFESTVAGLGYGAEGGEEPPVANGDLSDDVKRSQREWHVVRKDLKEQRRALTRQALTLYAPDIRLGDTGLLTASGWKPDRPLPLKDITLRWDALARFEITGREEESRSTRPLRTPTRVYERYHKAIRDLDRPQLFENRLCYRLVDANLRGDAPQLTFGTMCYFDMIDVGEAAAHEMAAQVRSTPRSPRPPGWERLGFRRLVRDPFEITAYPLLLSISTLTIRRSRSGSTFLLLERDARKVAIAGGMLSVLPTGVFQPASIVPAERSPDFDLWRNMMREYSEEYLGNPEHDGNGPPVDYENDEPFRSLNQAHDSGRVATYCLALGIDALNLVGDIISVAVFEADVFDSLFRHRVSDNDEGSVSNGGDTHFYDFSEGTLRRLLSTAALAPSGAASLALAWKHRGELLGIS